MQTCLFLHSRHAKIEEHGNLGLRVLILLHWTAWADKTTLLHGEAPSELKAGTGPCSQRAGGQGPLHLLHSLLVPWSSACLTLWTTLSSTHVIIRYSPACLFPNLLIRILVKGLGLVTTVETHLQIRAVLCM